MQPFGLNHMTAPHLTATELLHLAARLGCAGVEFRNDLGRDMFDGQQAKQIGALAKDLDVRIFALAEVKAFNDPAADAVAQAQILVDHALRCGAEGVALIPKVAEAPVKRSEQRRLLQDSLTQLRPLFEGHGVTGLIEPLGFETSTLRFKDDVALVLDEMGRPDCFKLIHDTFHHHLAETDTIRAELTALVHISGVEDSTSGRHEFTDAHRVLVGREDRLENLEQLRSLAEQGYKGALSFEAFAPDIHALTDPAKELAGSISFIADHMIGEPA